jgi:hypothetical protein
MRRFPLCLIVFTVLASPAGVFAQKTLDPDSTYTIHAVIRIMNPVNVAAMNDGRQTASIVRKTDEFTEVAVTCFPLLEPTPTADPNWRQDDATLPQYTQPGLTSNWDSKMRSDLIAALLADGIDVAQLDDKSLVEQVSRWLLKRSKYISMFDTWFVDFSGPEPRILPGLEQAARDPSNIGDPTWTFREQFDHELFGRSMFYLRMHGSCTSYAIYQATIFKALGIPTRIFLTIPIVDVNDTAQVQMADANIHHHRIHNDVMEGLRGSGSGFSNHTYDEVFVGGQWVTLNYDRLGQPMVDPNYDGLMVHIDTLSDWADNGYTSTWGKRYALSERSEALPTGNPYSTLSLTDEFGKDAHIDNPQVDDGVPRTLTISKIYWNPANGERQRNLLLYLSDERLARNYRLLKGFLQRSAHDLTLTAPGHEPVVFQVTAGSHTSSPDLCEIYVHVPQDQYAKMDAGVQYSVQLPADQDGYHWQSSVPLTIAR